MSKITSGQRMSLLLGILSLLMAIAAVVFSHFTKVKIVYVDSSRLLENYEGMKAAQTDFQQKSMLWQANIDTLTKEFQKAVDDFEAAKSTLSKKESALSQELIRTKRKQLMDYQQAIQQQSSQEDYQLTQKVLTEVNEYINEYAEQQGYDLVLGATGAGNIVYGEEAMDITDEVLLLINDKYAGR